MQFENTATKLRRSDVEVRKTKPEFCFVERGRGFVLLVLFWSLSEAICYIIDLWKKLYMFFFQIFLLIRKANFSTCSVRLFLSNHVGHGPQLRSTNFCKEGSKQTRAIKQRNKLECRNEQGLPTLYKANAHAIFLKHGVMKGTQIFDMFLHMCNSKILSEEIAY